MPQVAKIWYNNTKIKIKTMAPIRDLDIPPEGDRVDEKFETPPLPKDKVPDGSRVFLKGIFVADEVGTNADWDSLHAMTRRDDGSYECTVPGMQAEREYQFKIFVVKPDGTEQWIGGKGGTNLRRKITAPAGGRENAAETGESRAARPAATQLTGEIRDQLKGRVAEVLEAAQSQEGARDLEGLFDSLERDLKEHDIKEDVTAAVLALVVESIRGMSTLPVAIRNQFPEGQEVPDFKDFERRMRLGSAAYRRKVFERLRADLEAKRALHLEGAQSRYDANNPLGDPEHNRLFDRLCSQRDLGHLTPHLQQALRSVADVPAASPRLAAQRKELLRMVEERLTPEKRSALMAKAKEIPPTRVGKIVDLALQAGLLYFSWPVWLAKAGIETVTGVNAQDVISAVVAEAEGKVGPGAGGILRQAFDRNILTRLLTAPVKKVKRGDKMVTEGGAGKVLLNSLLETAFRAIPGVSQYKNIGPLEGAHGEPADHDASEHADHADFEELINDACEKALNIK